LERHLFDGFPSDHKTHLQEQSLAAPAFGTPYRLDGVFLNHFPFVGLDLHFKERMRGKREGKLLVKPQHFRGFIDEFLVTVIAPDSEIASQSRRRGVSIRLGKRNSMLMEKIPSPMKPIILAQDNPAITVIPPH